MKLYVDFEGEYWFGNEEKGICLLGSGPDTVTYSLEIYGVMDFWSTVAQFELKEVVR